MHNPEFSRAIITSVSKIPLIEKENKDILHSRSLYLVEIIQLKIGKLVTNLSKENSAVVLFDEMHEPNEDSFRIAKDGSM